MRIVGSLIVVVVFVVILVNVVVAGAAAALIDLRTIEVDASVSESGPQEGIEAEMRC